MEKELKDLQKMSREELIAYALKEAKRADLRHDLRKSMSFLKVSLPKSKLPLKSMA